MYGEISHHNVNIELMIFKLFLNLAFLFFSATLSYYVILYNQLADDVGIIRSELSAVRTKIDTLR